MSHLFKLIENGDYSSVEGPALIVKNVTLGPFEIDEDGRILSSMRVAAIDESCPICKAGIEEGKLRVLHTASAAKPPKAKAKNVQPVEVEPQPQPEPTVAVTEDNSSVQ